MRRASPLAFALFLFVSSTFTPSLLAQPKQDRNAVLVELARLDTEIVALAGQGQFARASRAAEGQLDRAERALGPDDPEVARILGNLAVLYRKQGVPVLAEPAYQRALAIQQKVSGPDDPDVARIYHNLAVLYQDRGDLKQAEPLFRKALAIREKALGPSDPSVAGSLNGLATVLAKRGDLQGAEDAFLRAIAIEEKALPEHHPDLAQTRNNLGTLYLDRGEYARAEILLKRALEAREQTLGATHPEVAESLTNLGSLSSLRGDLRQAETFFKRSISIREALLGPDHPDLAPALENLATVYENLGDYAKAAPLFERGRTLLTWAYSPKHPDVAVATLNLAHFRHVLGDDAQAEALFKEAHTSLEASLGTSHPHVAAALRGLAALYLDRDELEKAEPLLKQSLDITARAFGNEHTDYADTLVVLASVAEKRGELDRAEAEWMRARTLFEKNRGPSHPRVAYVNNELGALAARRGQLAKAASLIERALDANVRALGTTHPSSTTALQNLGLVRAMQGDIPGALADLSNAATGEDKLTLSILSAFAEQEKLHHVEGLRQGVSNAIWFHLNKAPTHQAAARLAMRSILRRKGLVVDVTGRQVATLRARLDGEDRKLLDSLTAVLGEIASLVSRPPPQMDDARRNERIAELERVRATIEDAISRRASLAAELPRLPSIDEIAHALPEGAALIELVMVEPPFGGARRYAVYTLSPSGDVRGADLGDAASIEEAVRSLRFALSHPHIDPKPPAHALYRKIMAPAMHLVDDNSWLFVSPDGALWTLPLHALVDDAGHWLVENKAIELVTTGRDLLRFREKPMPSRTGPLFVANPAFGHSKAPRTPATAAGRARLAFSALPGTEEEARHIAAHLPDARLLVGRMATEAAVKSVVGPRFLHLSTHGFFLREQADASAKIHPLLRAGVALANANTEYNTPDGDDGILTALEVSAMDLRGTQLAVLSACETGLGDVREGEGVMGMLRALMLTGAETTLASLWKVDDQATRALMEAYYARLLQDPHLGRGEALRQAQRTLLQDKAFQHPFSWAGFVSSGNPASLSGALTKPPIPSPSDPTQNAAQLKARGCRCAAVSMDDPAHPGAALLMAATFWTLRRRMRAREKARRACIHPKPC